MKAIIRTGDGGPEVLKLTEVPAPIPGPKQLLVDVKATALNRLDTLQRGGLYPPPTGESEILGLEIAGTVEAIGDEVTSFSRGNRVFGLISGGGYAEQALIDYRMAIPLPEGWDFEQAAAIPEVFFTANETLFTLGRLCQNETVLIHAGGSGVGTAGTQMAHQIGARVFITAGSEDKIKKSKAIGCTEGINYKTCQFRRGNHAIDQGRGRRRCSGFYWRALSRTESIHPEAAWTSTYGRTDGWHHCRNQSGTYPEKTSTNFWIGDAFSPN